MPQGRRKIPFSGKAKRLQMQSKRQGKAYNPEVLLKHPEDGASSSFADNGIRKINFQPGGRPGRNANRYALQFHGETDAEIKQNKEEARLSLNIASAKDLEIDGDQYFQGFDFPKRPKWEPGISVQALENNEQRYFTEYVKFLERNNDGKPLSYFELNLETWRQLWRVLEMSDIILIIVDIRFSALMFPPSLYSYVTNELGKHMILVLNKVDLAPAPLVVAWRNYFKIKFPELHVLVFTSYPGYNLRGNTDNKAGLQVRRRRGKLRMAAEGAQQLFKVCQDIVENHVDLSTWETKILEEMTSDYETDDVEVAETTLQKPETGFVEHEKFKNGILTIGCVGQPNVGKSSLMNAIMGKKVVSVSKTPGHTKHFQTIFLTGSVRLCDCPGLVFPSSVPKPLQVLMGSYPIAQLREPFSAVRYVAERMDLPTMLRLTHPDNDDTWSPIDVCEGWAIKRGYLTARAARPDIHRAANSLLRMCLEGKLCLCLKPPGYSEKEDYWEAHEDVEDVKRIQAVTSKLTENIVNEKFVESESDESSLETEHENEEECARGSEDEDAIAVSSNKFAVLMN